MLTKHLQDVEAECGPAVVQELRDRVPGIMLYIPHKYREQRALSRLTKATRNALMEHFPAETLYIPSNRPTYQETFERIEPLIEKGLTVQQVALKLRMTEAWVRRCRAKAGAPKIYDKVDPRQGRLFDEE